MKRKELFTDVIGQEKVKLAVQDWYLHEKKPLLLWGPSGHGKTEIAESLGAITIDSTQMRGDRISTILKPIKEALDGDILFYDEIHSLQQKITEGLYKIIDKGTFYDPELCMDLPIPNVRFIFATNLLNKLPEAFINRCRVVKLQDYTQDEIEQIIHKKYPEIEETALKSIVRASKLTPRTALNIASSVIAGAKTDKVLKIDETEVNNILETRMEINSMTGLTQKEFMIIQKVVEHGHLSTIAVANLLKISRADAQRFYIDPLKADEWLAISSQGVIPGFKTHENYRLFVKRLGK